MRPVRLPPVNPTASTPGWVTIASPTTGPSPITRLTVPAGRPARSRHSQSLLAIADVDRAGSQTIVLPVAMAGAM